MIEITAEISFGDGVCLRTMRVNREKAFASRSLFETESKLNQELNSTDYCGYKQKFQDHVYVECSFSRSFNARSTKLLLLAISSKRFDSFSVSNE